MPGTQTGGSAQPGYLRGVGGSSANLGAGEWLAWPLGVLSGEPMLFRDTLSGSRATALALAFSFSRSVWLTGAGVARPPAPLGGLLQPGGRQAALPGAEETGVDTAAHGPGAGPPAGHAHGAGLGRSGQAAVLDVGTGARSQEAGLCAVGHVQAGLASICRLDGDARGLLDLAERGRAPGLHDGGRACGGRGLLVAEGSRCGWARDARGRLLGVTQAVAAGVRGGALQAGALHRQLALVGSLALGFACGGRTGVSAEASVSGPGRRGAVGL